MRVYNLPTDALVVFSAATNMPRPYKIKYQTEYGKTVTVKIDTILYTEKQKYCGKNVLLFHCQSEIKGNMDSDGTVSTRKGQGVYTSTEKALSESVSELLWSLGIKNAVTTAVSTQRNDWGKPSSECGRKETGRDAVLCKVSRHSAIRR